MPLAAVGDAMSEVNAAIDEMRREHDPLVSHLFVSRRQYQRMSDTKSGKRCQVSAQLSWQQACDLGFRDDLESVSDSWGWSAVRIARLPPELPRFSA